MIFPAVTPQDRPRHRVTDDTFGPAESVRSRDDLRERRAERAARPIGRQVGERHAVYVTVKLRDGSAVTFRVGQPTNWHRASARWHRLDARRAAGRVQTVRHDGRRYPLDTARGCVEVRAVDAHGRGLGSERHALAFPVPYRALRVAS